jgi:hypothetical protein
VLRGLFGITTPWHIAKMCRFPWTGLIDKFSPERPLLPGEYDPASKLRQYIECNFLVVYVRRFRLGFLYDQAALDNKAVSNVQRQGALLLELKGENPLDIDWRLCKYAKKRGV